MSENYIVINGKKAELTPEQLKALGIEVKKPSPFDRAREGKKYYTIISTGEVFTHTERFDPVDIAHYRFANYCTDQELLQQQGYRETLNRLLWRFSMEHGGEKVTWDGRARNWKIKFYNNKWTTEWNQSDHVLGCVYFCSQNVAEQAIEEIVKPFMAAHPDFEL